MEKSNKRTIILTAILSMIFTICLIFTIAMISSDPIPTTSAETEDSHYTVEVNDVDGLIENEIGEHFFFKIFLESATENFEIESATVAYSHDEYYSVILLTVTDESFGKHISKYIESDNKDEYLNEIEDNLISSSEMLTSRLKGDVTIELNTTSMPNNIFIRLIDNEIDYNITNYLFEAF